MQGAHPTGRHGDGGGLYLHVKPSGAKSWCQRITVRGRRRDYGLGGFPPVTLAEARILATRNRATVAAGGDPLAERRRARAPTFAVAAARVHELHRPRWRSTTHPADWRATLERHALPKLGDITGDAISRADVVDVLTPIWTSKPETARRVRQRIRTVMQWAIAHSYAERNPAGEAITGALPAMPKVNEHLRALPYTDVPTALTAIEDSGCIASRKGLPAPPRPHRNQVRHRPRRALDGGGSRTSRMAHPRIPDEIRRAPPRPPVRRGAGRPRRRGVATRRLRVHLPTTDGRHLALPRHTQPTRDHRLLLDQLKLRLPEQPPPRISA